MMKQAKLIVRVILLKKFKYFSDMIQKIRRKKRLHKGLTKMMLHSRTCLPGSTNSLYRKQVTSGVFVIL